MEVFYTCERLKSDYENLLIEHKKLKELYAKQTAEFREAKKRYAYYEARFVKVCKECDDEQRSKCIMYPEYCEGVGCEELVDLEQLVTKNDSDAIIENVKDWVRNNLCEDGCIDCDCSETDKLKKILKMEE